MNHEEYKDLLALAALDSLDAADASALQDHLATCEECRRELSEWRNDVALLALSVDKIAPPENLRARILDRLKETNTFPLAQTNGDSNTTSETSQNEETKKVLPLRSRNNAGVEKVFAGKSAVWSGALAASLVAALITALIVFWPRKDTKQEEQARLSNRNNDKQAALNQALPRNDETPAVSVPSSNTNTAPSANDTNQAPSEINRLPNRNDNDNRRHQETGQREVTAPTANRAQVIESPSAESPVTESIPSMPNTQIPFVTNARVVQLSGTAKAPQARGTLIFDKSAGKITVTVSDLPPPTAGKAYQLWFIVKGHPIPGSVFVTGQEGRAMIHGQIPVRARNASAFAITLEESNGANKPSEDKYLLGSISAS